MGLRMKNLVLYWLWGNVSSGVAFSTKTHEQAIWILHSVLIKATNASVILIPKYS